MAHMIVCPKLSVRVTRDAGSTLETPGASPGTDGRPATQAFLVIAALGLITSLSLDLKHPNPLHPDRLSFASHGSSMVLGRESAGSTRGAGGIWGFGPEPAQHHERQLAQFGLKHRTTPAS